MTFLLFGIDLCCVEDIKRFLSLAFNMNDLGVAKVILEIKIIRDDDGIIISQSQLYQEDLTCSNVIRHPNL